MTRVVRLLGQGSTEVSEAPQYPKVDYLILELATGDSRQIIDTFEKIEYAFALRTLHNVCVGLSQLHYRNIAHQDLKPSNVLVFDADGSKIGDVGRAGVKYQDGPFDSLILPGDPQYAPPEQLYKYQIPDWNIRRFGCDAYHLGSLATFFFFNLAMTPALVAQLDDTFRPANWTGKYDELLPYLDHAFASVLTDFNESINNSELSGELTSVVEQLCNPNPYKRGHPKNLRSNSSNTSLERYISIFDRLAKRAENGYLNENRS